MTNRKSEDEEREVFTLWDYVDSWEGHPHDVRFSVPLAWLLEYTGSDIDEEGDYIGLSVSAEIMYRDALMDGVVECEEVD